jgi:sugar lactone lactonase YvrE
MSESKLTPFAVCLVLLACGSKPDSKLDVPFVSLKEILSVGELEGAPGEWFGEVAAVVPDRTGGFFVLDNMRKSIKHFSPGGELLETVGREGRGPGEFRYPEGMEFDDQGRLWVVDRGNLRVSVFSTDSGRLALEQEIEMLFPFQVTCRLGHRFFALGFYQDKIVHELTPDGHLLNSFGDPHLGPEYLSQRWRDHLTRTLDRGRILCVAGLRLVLTLPHNLPHIRAFSPEGTLVWQVELQGFHTIHHTETAYGTLRWDADPETGTAHFNTGISYVGDRLLMVQVVETGGGRYPEDYPVETRFLSLEDGSQVTYPGDLPIVTARDGRTWFAFSNHPYPRVFVYEGSIERARD